ncbi:MAG: ferrochelatase [Magnetovibrio sp.]|nr:ferrochelatase [Magnetovibrio sp.]
MARTAVVMFNLGGPDSPDAMQPFLFNLFNDPAIIGAPGPVRWLLAKWISSRRAPVAREIYAHLGGKSPLLELTEAQAAALQDQLAGGGDDVRTFIAMRYWHPMSAETATAVAAFAPDQIVLLPLYPQFSTTTVGSSLAEWRRAAHEAGLTAPTRAVCCYPLDTGWIAAQADLVGRAMSDAGRATPLRVLFSAHGLPKKVIAAGDPYQWQVERTADAVVAAVNGGDGARIEDWTVCYQSRVGPLEWIGPSTEDELARAGRDGVGVVVVPIAFVSEHSETLVELDIEYREEAGKLGVPAYIRVPAVATHAAFIDGLAGLVENALARDAETLYGGDGGARLCPRSFGQCPCGA